MILSSVLLLRRYLETSHLKIPMIFLDELSGSWQIHSTLVMRNFFSRRISLISIVHLEFNRWLPFPSCLSFTTNNSIYKWNYFLSWSFYSTVNLITKKNVSKEKVLHLVVKRTFSMPEKKRCSWHLNTICKATSVLNKLVSILVSFSLFFNHLYLLEKSVRIISRRSYWLNTNDNFFSIYLFLTLAIFCCSYQSE